MKKRALALCCALALTLTACAVSRERENPPEGSTGVYFAVSEERTGGPAVKCEYHVLSGEEPAVEELMRLLLAGPAEPGLTSPFPPGVSLRSWRQEEGRLTLDLSEQYGGLSGVDLTVADYCIALTLCQIPEVDSVSITVEGEELAFRHMQQLTAEDVILSGAEEEPVYVSAALWFPRREGDGLGVETRQLLLTEDDTLAGVVSAALLSGPSYESLTPAVPEGTELRAVTVEDGICVLDLSDSFLEGQPNNFREARLMIYGLVNTLCSLSTAAVEAVQIRVEGAVVDYYGGLPLSSPLEPDFTLEK